MASLADGRGDRRSTPRLWATRNRRYLCQRAFRTGTRRACRNSSMSSLARQISLRCRTFTMYPSNNHTSHRHPVISQTLAKDGHTRTLCLQPVRLFLLSTHRQAPTGSIKRPGSPTRHFNLTWSYSSTTCSRSCQSFPRTSISTPIFS
jgi:hypothetical protein